MLLVLNLPLVGLGQAAEGPKPQLYAGILIFATVGAYGMRQSAFDLFCCTPSACWAGDAAL